MARHTNYLKRDAERRFRHTVDIPVPSGGLGGKLNQMHQWCLDNIGPLDTWTQHGHSMHRPEQIPESYARFYFKIEEDAELFRCRWSKQ